MKGKIRVYARCRPMAQYEKDRDCEQVLRFTGDQDLEVMKERGPKEFSFDAVFPATTAQDKVFEDCRHLVQSCLDGYNVCIFAYGQVSRVWVRAWAWGLGVGLGRGAWAWGLG